VILVTGSSGFIGSALVARLAKSGRECIGIDKVDGLSTADFVGFEALVANSQPSVIVHLGANCSSQISLREPQTDFVDNVLGTFNVCEVSRLHGNIPIIFNSSMKVQPGDDGLIAPYGLSKIVGESYLDLFHKIYGVDSVINRPSSVYGPGQNGSTDGGWFTWFIKASIEGLPITLFGDGTQSRDVLYIDDHIELLIDQIDHFDLYSNTIYDFGGGPSNEVSLNELLDVLKYKNLIVAPKLPADVQRLVNDNQEITSVNGWQPSTNWLKGVELTRDAFVHA